MTEEEQPHTHQGTTGLRVLLTAAAVVVIIAGLKAASSILLPVLMAAFLAVLSVPPISWLRKRGLPAWASVLIVFTGVLVVILALTALIGTSLTDFSRNLPTYQVRIQERTASLLEWVQKQGVDVSTAAIKENMDTGRVMKWTSEALKAVSSIFSNMFFVLLTVVFILAEAAGLPAKIRAALGQPEADLGRYARILEDIQTYLSIKTKVSAVTGALATALLAVVGVDYVVMWGLLAFMLNFVPTLGSILAALPPVLLALILFGWERAVVVGVGYLVINVVMGSVLEPRLMGRRLGLSTLVVFLSLVFWGWVWGPVGMVLCVPLTMVLKILLENTQDLQWIAVLLGSGAETRERTSKMEP